MMDASSSVPVFDGPEGGEQAMAFIRSRVPFTSARFVELPLHHPQVVRDWVFKGTVYGRHDGNFFELVGGTFSPGGREVASWPQPLLKAKGPPGVVVLMAYDADGGDLQFLVQTAAEPGNVGVLLEADDETLTRYVDENRGEIVTFEVDGRSGRALLSTVLMRPPFQASASNLEKFNVRVPLSGMYRELADAGRIQFFAQVEDGGRHLQKRDVYGVVFLTAEERDRVNAEIESPPKIPVDPQRPEGDQKPAWDGRNFCWVSESVFEHLERQAAANAYLVNLVGRAVRHRGRPVQPLRFVKITK